MKKIMLAFVGVVLMASSSPAAIVSLDSLGAGLGSAGNPITLTTETVIVGVSTDAGLFGLNVTLTILGSSTASGIISDAIRKSDLPVFGWDPTLSFDPAGDPGAAVEIGVGSFVGSAVGLVAFFDIQATAISSGVIKVLLTSTSGFGGSADLFFGAPTVDATVLDIHVIPEPMTVGLLALGGLGLIRRLRRVS